MNLPPRTISPCEQEYETPDYRRTAKTNQTLLQFVTKLYLQMLGTTPVRPRLLRLSPCQKSSLLKENGKQHETTQSRLEQLSVHIQFVFDFIPWESFPTAPLKALDAAASDYTLETTHNLLIKCRSKRTTRCMTIEHALCKQVVPSFCQKTEGTNWKKNQRYAHRLSMWGHDCVIPNRLAHPERSFF